MKIFTLRLIFLSLVVILHLTLMNTAKANHNVACTAGVNAPAGTTGTVNLGNALTVNNLESASITVPVNIRCTNSGTSAANITVCLATDGGDYINNAIEPRFLRTGANPPRLAFQMTLPNSNFWSSRTYHGINTEYYTGIIPIAVRNSATNARVENRSFNLVVSLLPGYGNNLAAPGTYFNDFGNGNHTSLTFLSAHTNVNLANYDCRPGAQGTVRFPFRIQATVIGNCTVNTSSDVNLGSHVAGTTNIAGNNSSAINVTCTQNLPYRIGLLPSNASQTGAGVMRGTGINTDSIPYQLRSATGANGAIWGNTATATTTGNGISRTGTGANQLIPVYVTVPNTNVTPDDYSDTVTIRVHY